jgi:hypothetical protein
MATKDRRRPPKRVPAKGSPSRKPVRKERRLRDSDVVYTPPKPFQRGRFLLRLITVTAVVLAMVLGMSIFFKVEHVKVSGCVKYSAWDVSEASGIEKGTNLMTISRAQISGNIISKLPYVASVRVGINLPDTVNIEIAELEVVYAAEDTEGNWWLMNDQGKVVEKTNAISAKEYTRVLGVKLQDPQVGQQAVAKEEQAETIAVTDPTQEGEETTEPSTTAPTIAVGITGAERLRTVLMVLQQLSNNSISGQMDSVDVTSLSSIELWYNERFQINLGDTSQLEYKILALEATINQMESYESGHLDLSFTNWPDKVGYTPFT